MTAPESRRDAETQIRTLPVADRWFAAAPAGEGITLLTEPHATPYIWSNLWHVRGRTGALLVDSGNGIGRLAEEASTLSGELPTIAVVTHSHFDHMGGLHEFEERWCHRDDAAGVRDVADPLRLLGADLSDAFRDDMAHYGYEPPELLLDALPFEGFDVEGFRTLATSPTRVLAEGDAIDLGNRTFEVLHVPGHTPGSIALWDETNGALFTGDTVYVDDPLGAEDLELLCGSLERLRRLPVEVVYAGHGRSFGRDELLATIDAFLSEAEGSGGVESS